jgi:hypothetical protein
MRRTIPLALTTILGVLAACASPGASAAANAGSAIVEPPKADGSGGPDATAPGAGGDPYRAIFDAVDQNRLLTVLDEMTGTSPVTVGGDTFRITERWSAPAKAQFRAYWKQFFVALGMTVTEETFPVANQVGETEGHNLEAVLPGKSADSLIVIAHYDSVGVTGHEKENPAVDDAASGMAIAMEAARILTQYPNAAREKTVRFVVADYEEITDSLDGDVAYVKQIQSLAQESGFSIVAAFNLDQTSWSCWNENRCGESPPPESSTFTVTACTIGHDFPDLADAIGSVATAYSPLAMHTDCETDPEDVGTADVSPFWVAGIPGLYFQEYDVDDNPHYDETGDDTRAHVDVDYYAAIARVGVASIAKLVGVDP